MEIDEFERVKDDLEVFSQKVNRLVTEQKRSLLSQRTEYSIAVSNCQSDEVSLQKQISRLQEDKHTIEARIKDAFEDFETRKTTLNKVREEEAEFEAKYAIVQQEVDGLRARIADLEVQMGSIQQNLQLQAQQDEVDIAKFEKYLGLRIEVVDVNVIKFIFTCIDANDADKETFFVVNVENELTVTEGVPSLDDAPVEKVVREYEADNNFGRFLGEMRKLLVSDQR